MAPFQKGKRGTSQLLQKIASWSRGEKEFLREIVKHPKGKAAFRSKGIKKKKKKKKKKGLSSWFSLKKGLSIQILIKKIGRPRRPKKGKKRGSRSIKGERKKREALLNSERKGGANGASDFEGGKKGRKQAGKFPADDSKGHKRRLPLPQGNSSSRPLSSKGKKENRRKERAPSS